MQGMYGYLSVSSPNRNNRQHQEQPVQDSARQRLDRTDLRAAGISGFTLEQQGIMIIGPVGRDAKVKPSLWPSPLAACMPNEGSKGRLHISNHWTPDLGCGQ